MTKRSRTIIVLWCDHYMTCPLPKPNHSTGARLAVRFFSLLLEGRRILPVRFSSQLQRVVEILLLLVRH